MAINIQIDPRARISLFILLSLAHGIASLQTVPILLVISSFFILIWINEFLKNLKLILISALAIGVFIFFVWFLGSSFSFREIFWGYLRWVSLISVTVAIFFSLNLLEFVSSLVYFRLPYPIALGMGIGLRFLPVVFDEARRTKIIQRHNGISFSILAFKKYGFFELFNRLLSPLFVSVIRRVDSLMISLALQQVENRVKNYRFEKMKYFDYVAIVVVSCFFVFEIISRV